MEALVQASQVMQEKKVATTQTTLPDCIMMKDGKMVEIKNGKIQRMTADITFDNGRQISTMGEVMETNGTLTQMKEGDAINMNGKWMENVNVKQKK